MNDWKHLTRSFLILGGCLALLLVIGIAWWCWSKKRGKTKNAEEEKAAAILRGAMGQPSYNTHNDDAALYAYGTGGDNLTNSITNPTKPARRQPKYDEYGTQHRDDVDALKVNISLSAPSSPAG